MKPDQLDSTNKKADEEPFTQRFNKLLEAKNISADIDHLHLFVSNNIEAVRREKDRPTSGISENEQDLRYRLLEGQQIPLHEYIKEVKATEVLPDIGSLNEVLMASWTGQTDKVKKLVSKNYSLEIQDSTGRDPAEIAKLTGNRELQDFVNNQIDQSHRM